MVEYPRNRSFIDNLTKSIIDIYMDHIMTHLESAESVVVSKAMKVAVKLAIEFEILKNTVKWHPSEAFFHSLSIQFKKSNDNSLKKNILRIIHTVQPNPAVKVFFKTLGWDAEVCISQLQNCIDPTEDILELWIDGMQETQHEPSENETLTVEKTQNRVNAPKKRKRRVAVADTWNFRQQIPATQPVQSNLIVSDLLRRLDTFYTQIRADLQRLEHQ